MSRRPKPSGQGKRTAMLTTAQCPPTGKMAYTTELSAMMALARLKVQRPSLKAVYQCPHPQCQQWHLTSQEQK